VPKPPRVGDIVTFYNAHGFPRAAIVTGTMESLVGEQHVRLIDDPYVVHLHVMSPLPRSYDVQSVPMWNGAGTPVAKWRPR